MCGIGGRTWCTASSCKLTRMHLIDWVSASAVALSAGLSSQHKDLRLFPSKTSSTSPRVQTSPNPKSRKKSANHPSSPPSNSCVGREVQSLPSPRRWASWIRNDMKRCTWTCLSDKTDPFAQIKSILRKTNSCDNLPL